MHLSIYIVFVVVFIFSFWIDDLDIFYLQYVMMSWFKCRNGCPPKRNDRVFAINAPVSLCFLSMVEHISPFLWSPFICSVSLITPTVWMQVSFGVWGFLCAYSTSTLCLTSFSLASVRYLSARSSASGALKACVYSSAATMPPRIGPAQ